MTAREGEELRIEAALDALRDVATAAAQKANEAVAAESAQLKLTAVNVSAGSAAETALDLPESGRGLLFKCPEQGEVRCLYVAEWKPPFGPEGEAWDAVRSSLERNVRHVLAELAGSEPSLAGPSMEDWHRDGLDELIPEPLVRIDYELSTQAGEFPVSLFFPATMLTEEGQSEPEKADQPSQAEKTSMAEEKGGKIEVRQPEFPEFSEPEGERVPRNLEMLYDLTLTVSVELGRTQMTIGEVLELGKGSIIELDKLAGDPVDLYINGRKFAEGDVVVVEDRFGVRVTSLVGKAERIESLGGGK